MIVSTICILILHAALNSNSARLFKLSWITILLGIIEIAGHFLISSFDQNFITSSILNAKVTLPVLSSVAGTGCCFTAILQYLLYKQIDYNGQKYNDLLLKGIFN